MTLHVPSHLGRLSQARPRKDGSPPVTLQGQDTEHRRTARPQGRTWAVGAGSQHRPVPHQHLPPSGARELLPPRGGFGLAGSHCSLRSTTPTTPPPAQSPTGHLVRALPTPITPARGPRCSTPRVLAVCLPPDCAPTPQTESSRTHTGPSWVLSACTPHTRLQ